MFYGRDELLIGPSAPVCCIGKDQGGLSSRIPSTLSAKDRPVAFRIIARLSGPMPRSTRMRVGVQTFSRNWDVEDARQSPGIVDVEALKC